MALEEEIERLDSIYQNTKKREEELWKPYQSEADTLAQKVRAEFDNVLAEIGPMKSPSMYESRLQNGATVSEYAIEYLTKIKKFLIKIDKIDVKGQDKIECPHIYISPIAGYPEHPRVKKFMEEFHVYFIEYPENDCDHK